MMAGTVARICRLIPHCLMLAVLALLVSCRPEAAPPQPWGSRISPEAGGLDSALLGQALEQLARDGRVDSLILLKRGAIVAEAYFPPCAAGEMHELASVTKSVVSLLLGIAIERGLLTLDSRVVEFFPEYAGEAVDPRTGRLTLRHLVSMSGGQRRFPGEPYSNSGQGLDWMMRDGDWLRSALLAPMAREPGSDFYYFSPATHLLGAAIARAAGLKLADFARRELFGPLGITDFIWDEDPKGNSTGWAGLKLRTMDLAKLAWLVQQEGFWQGRQLVPSAWLAESVKPRFRTDHADEDYGLGWWVPHGGGFNAEGRGGQYLAFFPGMDAVLVATGSGCDLGTLTRTIGPAFKGAPLPENPAGAAALAASLERIGRAPAGPSERERECQRSFAAATAGRSYVLADNPLGVTALRFAFDSGGLELAADRPGTARPVAIRGGLGVWTGQPVLGRAAFPDPRTMVLDSRNFRSLEWSRLVFRIDGDRLAIEGRDMVLGADLPVVEGRRQGR